MDIMCGNESGEAGPTAPTKTHGAGFKERSRGEKYMEEEMV